MTEKVAIYTRVSTTEQAKDGFGLDVQSDQCKAMAFVKGWDVVKVFRDEGVSGVKDETGRPGLASLIQAIEDDEIDAVIVSALDRIGRSTRLVLRFVDAFSSKRVELVSCKESLDTSTPSGKFVLRMFASLAELERDTIVERTTNGRDKRGTIDGEKGGRMPYGYKRNGNGIDINDREADIVRIVFCLKDNNRISMNAIAIKLNDDGIKTRRKGARWYPSSILSILKNRDKYLGGYRGDSKVRWPAIL